ncbi:TPA: hypothetical protein U1C40_002422 [Streptococcus suis]|nr:hypothetical protein [Streptococcus suis]HEM3629992.1 hypothetical protein [Streptococcus suis]HEM3648585.1 hypothetical protein [Streptococcus suis]HEM3649712.1 hypothetical protein [Streptococcus suis]
MEKLRKESWKNLVLATLIVLSIYVGIYLIAFHLISDTMLSKELVVGNILLYTPIVLFLTGLLYGFCNGFSPSLLALVLLLYPVTIFFFKEWIILYQIVYTLCALIGNGIGALLFSLRKKMRKNP